MVQKLARIVFAITTFRVIWKAKARSVTNIVSKIIRSKQIRMAQSFSMSFSLGSPMPSSLIAKRQSLSGRHGLS